MLTINGVGDDECEVDDSIDDNYDDSGDNNDDDDDNGGWIALANYSVTFRPQEIAEPLCPEMV